MLWSRLRPIRSPQQPAPSRVESVDPHVCPQSLRRWWSRPGAKGPLLVPTVWWGRRRVASGYASTLMVAFMPAASLVTFRCRSGIRLPQRSHRCCGSRWLRLVGAVGYFRSGSLRFRQWHGPLIDEPPAPHSMYRPIGATNPATTALQGAFRPTGGRPPGPPPSLCLGSGPTPPQRWRWCRGRGNGRPGERRSLTVS